MPSPQAELLTRLTETVQHYGATPKTPDSKTLTAESDTTLSKWFLGGRKVSYRMSCRFDDASTTVRFREVMTESSWGVPPPAMTVEKTTQSGTTVSASTKVKGAGGGQFDLGALRGAVDAAVRAAGWQFVFESGKIP